MQSKLKITIPKPCHENWITMTPKEKGRFCSSCAKTVVNFTKKSDREIQEYLVENKHQKTCGHFYKKQLDSIVIEIPKVTFQQELSFQKLFLLALFFVMGTTLFSCKYTDGKKQKIENVIVVDTLKKVEKEVDSLKKAIKKELPEVNNKQIDYTLVTTTGISICDDMLSEEENTFDLKDIKEVDELEEIIDGDIDFTSEELIPEDEIIVGYITEKPPRFKETKKLLNQKAKEDFDKRMRNFIQDNFDSSLTECLGLNEGKYRIFSQFTIDESGNTTDIKVKAPHPKLKKEVIKMFKKLPQFIPGEQAGKTAKTKYTIPIVFIIE